MPVATDTLSEFILPCIGILTRISHRAPMVFLSPFPSEPTTSANGTVKSISHKESFAPASAPIIVIPLSFISYIACFIFGIIETGTYSLAPAETFDTSELRVTDLWDWITTP